jgi:hypothetical protein
MRARGIAVAVTALTVLMPLPTTAETQQVNLDVEPVVRLAGSVIVGCGLKLIGRHGDGEVTAELMLADEVGDREFIFTTVSSPPKTIEQAWIATGGLDTRSVLGKSVKNEDGSLRARGALPGLPGSEFMRSLMVEGGTLNVSSRAVPDWQGTIPAPMPQRIRAAYLNCAGDLPK